MMTSLCTPGLAPPHTQLLPYVRACSAVHVAIFPAWLGVRQHKLPCGRVRMCMDVEVGVWVRRVLLGM